MPSGVIHLGQVAHRLPHLGVDCGRCGRHGRLSLDRLLAEHGPDMPMPALGRVLAADCTRMIEQRGRDVLEVGFSIRASRICLRPDTIVVLPSIRNN